MQNRIRKAQTGDQAAVLSLYEDHKQTILRLCQNLLLNEESAGQAAAQVFGQLFEALLAGRVSDEAEFARLAVRTAVTHCKMLTTRESSRAFRVPANSDFHIALDVSKLDLTGSAPNIILKNLPAFHRYIYVLHALCEYSPEQIARVLSTTTRAIERGLEAERSNVGQIAAIVQARRKTLICYDLPEFHADLRRDAQHLPVPASVDSAVRDHVRSICQPLEAA